MLLPRVLLALRALASTVCWAAGDLTGQPLEGHLATDVNGDLLLCLLISGTRQLVALRLPPPEAAASAPVLAGKGVEIAFSLPAVAVASVAATLHCEQAEARSRQQVPARDLLVLQPDGRLVLLIGGRQLCAVTLPSTSGPTAAYAQLLNEGSFPNGKQQPAPHASELSGSKRPMSAAEVRSADSDIVDRMAVASIPRPGSGTASSNSRGHAAADLTDVRSLADALEPIPAVVGLQASVALLCFHDRVCCLSTWLLAAERGWKPCHPAP